MLYNLPSLAQPKHICLSNSPELWAVTALGQCGKAMESTTTEGPPVCVSEYTLLIHSSFTGLILRMDLLVPFPMEQTHSAPLAAYTSFLVRSKEDIICKYGLTKPTPTR